jgi:hypothetical protein
VKVVQNMKLAFAIAALVVALPTAGWAAKPTAVVPVGESVELFAAIKAGDIDLRLIPKDSTTGLVMIKNKTKKPLSIKLPEAVAGVPVLAQGGFGAGMGAGGGNNNGNSNQNQSMGMGMGGMGMGGGMMGGMGGMGGGFFNVAPEKLAKVPVVGVCLEHGKKDPNARVPYELRPIETVAQNLEVIEVVKMLNRGEVDQHTAQAATWHLANGLSWQELSSKIGVKHLNGRVEPYFTRRHLELAMRVAREASRRAENAEKSAPAVSPGESLGQN